MNPATVIKGNHQKQNKLTKEILDDLSWFVLFTAFAKAVTALLRNLLMYLL